MSSKERSKVFLDDGSGRKMAQKALELTKSQMSKNKTGLLLIEIGIYTLAFFDRTNQSNL